MCRLALTIKTKTANKLINRTENASSIIEKQNQIAVGHASSRRRRLS